MITQDIPNWNMEYAWYFFINNNMLSRSLQGLLGVLNEIFLIHRPSLWTWLPYSLDPLFFFSASRFFNSSEEIPSSFVASSRPPLSFIFLNLRRFIADKRLSTIQGEPQCPRQLNALNANVILFTHNPNPLCNLIVVKNVRGHGWMVGNWPSFRILKMIFPIQIV